MALHSTQVCPIAHVKARSCNPECAEHEGDRVFNICMCRSHHVHSTSTRARTFDRQSWPCCFQSCAVDCSAADCNHQQLDNQCGLVELHGLGCCSAAAHAALPRCQESLVASCDRRLTFLQERARRQPRTSGEPAGGDCATMWPGSLLCSCVLLEPPVR